MEANKVTIVLCAFQNAAFFYMLIAEFLCRTQNSLDLRAWMSLSAIIILSQKVLDD
jgi:hypothetical protein